MGIRYANESLENLTKLAEQIDKKYGVDARIEFESGIAMTSLHISNIPKRNFKCSYYRYGNP